MTGAEAAAQGSDDLHIIGRKHACFASALHSAIHPAIIDLLHVHDGVPVLERHLILIGCTVVIHSTVPLLQGERRGRGKG